MKQVIAARPAAGFLRAAVCCGMVLAAAALGACGGGGDGGSGSSSGSSGGSTSSSSGSSGSSGSGSTSSSSGVSSSSGSSSSGAAPTKLTVKETQSTLTVSDGVTAVAITKQPWRLSWTRADGTLIAADANPGSKDPVNNPQYAAMQKTDGIDKAYPGLPNASYMPLGYYTGTAWQSVSALQSYSVDGEHLLVNLATSDKAGAALDVDFAADGTLELKFTPAATKIAAVEASFNAPTIQAYFGTGQRFGTFNVRGRSVPLWISHGPGSDRYSGTNEIAASFFWSPSGWGLWSATDARGEIDFGDPQKRADAINVMHEDDHLDLVLYNGTPTQVVSAYTARSGRPLTTPPDWMWQPMVWQDDDTTTDTVNALVDGMQSRNIPLGAVWLDNPWDAGNGSFDFNPTRFADPDALIARIHGKGVRLMVWLSPFLNGNYQTTGAANGWLVTGTRPDGNDATYFPTRSISAHVDFSNTGAYDNWVTGLQKLVKRGVDGVKMDRCEEDLSDTSVWANGLPNRLNHNPYCIAYHKAAHDAFSAERPDGDFVILARGGWTGDARYAGHWAGDNASVSGPSGLGSVLNSLLSLSSSGFVFSGSDVGGYDGTLQSGPSPLPIGLPSAQTYIRWAQLGALSPVMETPIPPWWVNEGNAVTVYRRYATLHSRLAPYTAQQASAAITQGIPIVRPLPYSYPDDAKAVAVDDEYLFGPSLLVAPVTGVALELGIVTRSVYLPKGGWTDFWSGKAYQGPTTISVTVTPEQMPLFVQQGATLPDGVSADKLP